MAETSTITRDAFPNYAGVKDIDDALAAELEAAGIEVHRFGFLKNGRSEVDTEVVGELHRWHFKRAWYYWTAEGPGIEIEAAEALHASHGRKVRVEGHCGCPSPREQFKGLAVGSYHVDSPSGLKALADTIRGLVERQPPALDEALITGIKAGIEAAIRGIDATILNLGSECDRRGGQDPETGEVPCHREEEEGCACSAALELGDRLIKNLRTCDVAKIAALAQRGDAPPSSPVTDAVGQAPTLSSGEDLAGLSAKATKGTWHIDMFSFHDIETGEEQPPQCEGICTHDDVGGLAESLATCSEPDARFIVALVNAYRSGNLIPRIDTPSPDAPAQASVRDARIHPQIWTAARELTADQKKHPEWLWFEPITVSFGRWATTAFQAPYIRADIALALSAAPAAPQDETDGAEGWSFDMDAAPRDRTPILLAVPSLSEGQAPYVGEAYFDPETGRGDWWWAGTGWGDYSAAPLGELYAPPIAWRPLPPPPSLPAQTQTSMGGDR